MEKQTKYQRPEKIKVGLYLDKHVVQRLKKQYPEYGERSYVVERLLMEHLDNVERANQKG